LKEIADVFVVNKADRPDADQFVKNLRLMLAPAFHNHTMPVPVIKTIASQKEGIAEFLKTITGSFDKIKNNEKRSWLLAEKAFHLIQQKKRAAIDKKMLKKEIEAAGTDFNLYRFIKNYY
jgi:LAO/AO transport system kinase